MFRLIRFSNYGENKFFRIGSSELLEVYKGIYPETVEKMPLDLGIESGNMLTVGNFQAILLNTIFSGYVNSETEVFKNELHYSFCSLFSILISSENNASEYISLVHFPKNEYVDFPIPIFSDNDGEIDMDFLCEHISELAIRDITEIDGDEYIILESWDFYSILKLYGYNNCEDFFRENSINTTFEDEIFYCDGCETYQWNTDGMMYNYIMDDCCIVGISCGCAVDYEIENIDCKILSNGDTVDEYIRRDTLDKIESDHPEIVLTKHAIYIAGMTDGRGGYYDGESCGESDPDNAVEAFFEEYPDKNCIVVFLEAGQFQSYFGVYAIEINNE